MTVPSPVLLLHRAAVTAPADDRAIYEYVRRAYSPVFAIRVWTTLLQGSRFARSVRRSFQREMAERGERA